jgi:tetratricopeptide (TPR) repeat protein
MRGPLSARRDAALALEELGRYDEAIAAFEEIVRDSIVDGPSLAALGRMWSARREWTRATRYFEQALPALGSDTLLINGFILHLARLGQFDRARALFRSRMRPLRFHHPPGHEAPIWEGQDIRGKLVLLDVGSDYFGDAFQFVRFARLVRQRGATVVVRGPERVRRLLATVPGVHLAISRSDNLVVPDYTASAFWLLLSLDVPVSELIGDTPYLSAPADLRDAWRKGIPPRDGLNIGIVWQGSNYWCPQNPYGRRSMPLEALRPLTRIEGVKLYSLQCGPGREELSLGPEPFPAIDLAPDFENTAAAILALDAVVTIDTSIAHLSGALGQTTYVMLPYSPCFRWGMGDEDCPWYRSAKLFRQPEPGDWSAVVSAVASRLSSRSGRVASKPAVSVI